MADLPPLDEEDPSMGENRGEYADVVADDDNMPATVGLDEDGEEEDASYVAGIDSDGMQISSSTPSDSHDEEAEDFAEEVRALHAEAAEEERRAMGGWTEEAAEAFKKELHQEWILRNSKIQVSQSPGLSDFPKEAADGRPAQTAGMCVHPAGSASRYSMHENMECPDFLGKKSEITDIMEAADGGSSRVSDDVLNLPRMEDGYSLHADMAGQIFVAVNSKDSKNLATLDDTQNRRQKSSLNDMAGPDIMDAQFGKNDHGGSSVILHATDAFPAQPIAGYSNEEAALLDLYAAQPLQDYPDPTPGADIGQLVAITCPK